MAQGFKNLRWWNTETYLDFLRCSHHPTNLCLQQFVGYPRSGYGEYRVSYSPPIHDRGRLAVDFHWGFTSESGPQQWTHHEFWNVWNFLDHDVNLTVRAWLTAYGHSTWDFTSHFRKVQQGGVIQTSCHLHDIGRIEGSSSTPAYITSLMVYQDHRDISHIKRVMMTHGGRPGGSGPKDHVRPAHELAAWWPSHSWWIGWISVLVDGDRWSWNIHRCPVSQSIFWGAVRLDMTVCLPNFVKKQIDWLNRFEQGLHLAMFKYFETIAELKHQLEVCWETYQTGLCKLLGFVGHSSRIAWRFEFWDFFNLGVVDGESKKKGEKNRYAVSGMPYHPSAWTHHWTINLGPSSTSGCEAGKC